MTSCRNSSAQHPSQIPMPCLGAPGTTTTKQSVPGKNTRPKAVSAGNKTNDRRDERSRITSSGKQAVKTWPGKKKRPKTVATDKKAILQASLNEQGRKGHLAIVGIGASAGGLQAFTTLFTEMPADSGMAFVLVVHLDPHHHSLLPELIQKHTQMIVHQVNGVMEVEPNRIYIIPQNKALHIVAGHLSLTDRVQPRAANLPIDALFHSLAEDQGRLAIGIILSGTGSDGTSGVKAIKAAAGMVMVQDEESAGFAGMPASAIATGLIDYILAPEKMPEQLLEHASRLNIATDPTAYPVDHDSKQALQNIYSLLRQRTNHDFSLYKKNTIWRRIHRRMAVQGINDINNYARYIEKSNSEVHSLFNDLLIGVTSFFRDPDAFTGLKQVLLKLLADKSDDSPVRVWVPGCSTGEEAYSIGITLQECMDELNIKYAVQIFATDINDDAIAEARAGWYAVNNLSGISAELLARYFSYDNNGRYQIGKTIRDMLIFAPQDLIKDPPFTRLDLISCRNLLIYLGPELQNKVLPLFHYSLKPRGLLFLGSYEALGTHQKLFNTIDKKWNLFRSKPSNQSRQMMLHFPSFRQRTVMVKPPTQEPVEIAEEVSVQLLVEAILRQSAAPTCVIVNAENNILYLHGRTSQFLEHAEGKISVNIVDMALPELRRELQSALLNVTLHKQEIIHPGIRIADHTHPLTIDLVVKPLSDDRNDMQGLKMVIFQEAKPSTKTATPRKKPSTQKTPHRNVEELERELNSSRETLHNAIEELQATNEELQSTNEELQSANEEMETSKEELQSLNEEATTVNAELQARIEELSNSNDDIKNLLDSTEIATIFLDMNLCIRRFTPRATKILPLTIADTGRPINHLASKIITTDLGALANSVLDDLSPLETDVVTDEGNCYSMRIRPYRTTNNVIDGVVIIFEDVTERKGIESALKISEERYRSLFSILSESIVVIDLDDYSWLDFNQGAHERLGYTREEFKGVSIFDLETDLSETQIRARLEGIKDNKNSEFETRHRTKGGNILDTWTRIQIIDLGGKQALLSSWRRRATDTENLER